MIFHFPIFINVVFRFWKAYPDWQSTFLPVNSQVQNKGPRVSVFTSIYTATRAALPRPTGKKEENVSISKSEALFKKSDATG